MSDDRPRSGCTATLGFSNVAAAFLSWALNHSVAWAILHFFLGPIYLLWALFVRTKEIVPALVAVFS